MTSPRTDHSSPDLLGIYLNDHLAGATAGTELARRVAAAQTGTRYGAELRTLAAELSQDRAALAGIMRSLHVPPRGYKISLAWLGEKAARLKLNGRLIARARSQAEVLENLRVQAAIDAFR